MFSFCLVICIGIYFIMYAAFVFNTKCSVILFESILDRISSNGKNYKGRCINIVLKINMSNTLNLFCLNCRVLRERCKRQAVFTFLKKKVKAYSYCKRHILILVANLCGIKNGKVIFSFHIDSQTLGE